MLQTSYALGSVCLYSVCVDRTLELLAVGAGVGSGKGEAAGKKVIFNDGNRG